MRIEQVVRDKHGTFAFRSKHTVIDDAFRIRVEIPWHARIRNEQLIHSFQRRFGQFHALIDLPGKQQIPRLDALRIELVSHAE